MEEQILTPAEKHYISMKKAQKKYYEKKAGPVENRRPRGRPRKEHWVFESGNNYVTGSRQERKHEKEHWVLETESEYLKNTGQLKVNPV